MTSLLSPTWSYMKPLLIFTLFGMLYGLDFDLRYMESKCGSSISFTESFHMDSSTGITYKNLQNCSTTVTAPNGFFVVAQITRFELELPLTGTCTDYLEVYDGDSIADSKLNTDLVCGKGSSVPTNFTSTGRSMTLQLITDSSGVDTGFNMVFVAATNAPCTSTQLLCNTSVCIPSSLECDGYNQCGDESDEQDCAAKQSSEGLDIVMVVAITLTCVILIACVVAFIVYRIHERNRWKKFVNSRMDDDDEIIAAGPSYPITHKYYKGLRGNPAYYANATNTANMTLAEKDSVKDTGSSIVERIQSPVST